MLSSYRNLRNNDWEEILEELNPAFDLLVKVGRQLIRKGEPFRADYFKECYRNLTGDQRSVLDSVLLRAFFRTTSKLGLAFAREFNIPVLFAWKLPDEWGFPKDALYPYLEIKPYKAIPTQFRRAALKECPEAITSSEMRELGRRKQRKEAPNYLLITNIESATADEKSEWDGTERK